MTHLPICCLRAFLFTRGPTPWPSFQPIFISSSTPMEDLRDKTNTPQSKFTPQTVKEGRMDRRCCRSRLLGHSWWDVGVAAVTWQVRSAPPAACLRGSEPPERWWLSPSLRPRLCGWTRTPDWWWSRWERCRVRWNPDKHQQRCASAPLNLNLKPPHVSSETCSAYRKDQALKRCSVKAIKSALDDFQTSDSYSDRSV